MARFEWLTPEKVMHSWGLLLVLGAFSVALISFYLGFMSPVEFRLFGVNGYFVAAGFHLLAGVFWLAHEYYIRPPVP